MNDLERARREAAELMGLNPDRLSPSDRLRCELIAALRSVIDDELAKVDRANASDLGKLIVAVEALTRFLAEAKPGAAERPEEHDGDPRENLMRIVENWIAADEAERAEAAAERRAQGLSEPAIDLKAAQARIDQLEAENARLRGEEPKLLAAPSTESEREPKVITPREADVIEPSRLYVGPPPPGPDDPPKRSTAVIDAKANPPAPPQQLSDAEREANRLRIANDRTAYTQQGLRLATHSEPWRPFTKIFE